MTGRAHVRIGCAGWALSSSVAARFPGEGSHLERYAQVFSCVEINSSFYRSHQHKTYRRWADSVPGPFRFSVKLPRTITHDRRLRSAEPEVDAFMHEVEGLEGKLGCLLVQLPPSLALDELAAGAFFSLVRRYTDAPLACEPRHPSWFTDAGSRLLVDAGVARVWADPSPVPEVVSSADRGLLYLRLHGSPHIYHSAYDDSFLDAMALQMREARHVGRDVWCIFDNTARGEAVPNALGLRQRLE
ncbi:DUF72 domain-containing protein [Luteibacter sp. PPL201]|uniref:DUF72 domain-containing protein n=1 Tax=Luteibacter sahnii TaxID=3021977 RepID=A0ABT6BB74_9GAMM|nr:DUF72 domain-containing protein [Luteibacter sp. PPL193]MDY1549423.1 DUF72 domain-containing protein [Luteibacter sp. PPL193]